MRSIKSVLESPARTVGCGDSQFTDYGSPPYIIYNIYKRMGKAPRFRKLETTPWFLKLQNVHPNTLIK